VFKRQFNHKRYKVISKDGFGITLKLPRYEKTDIRVGTKDEAEERGLNPKGSKSFYKLPDGSIVIDGFLAKPAEENRVKMTVKKDTDITYSNWNELKKEIEFMLDYTE